MPTGVAAAAPAATSRPCGGRGEHRRIAAAGTEGADVGRRAQGAPVQVAATAAVACHWTCNRCHRVGSRGPIVPRLCLSGNRGPRGCGSCWCRNESKRGLMALRILPAGSGKSLAVSGTYCFSGSCTKFTDSCNARKPIYLYFQSIFRIQNSEYAFHFICVFSVDFQKHASEYEVACF